MDAAMGKLRELVTGSKGQFTGFEYLEDLDDLMKVKKLLYFKHTYDDPPSSISTSLPSGRDEFCAAPLCVAARLLHKDFASRQITRPCFAFFPQNSCFSEWSRGDSNP